MVSTLRGGDFPGLTFDVPASVTTPAQYLALGQQNANIIAQTSLMASRANLKSLTLPRRKLVLGPQGGPGTGFTAPVNSGSPAMYMGGGGFGPGADEFFWHLDGTQIVMAGTDRNSAVGLCSMTSVNGPCGISGSGSVDYAFPQTVSGFVSKIIDSTHIVVTTDQPWLAVDIDKIVAYDPVYDRLLGRLAYSGSGGPYLTYTAATGTNAAGGMGTDYLVDLTNAPTINTTLMVAGTEVVLTTTNLNFLFSATQSDKFVLPKELRLYQSCNGVFYGQATSLDADFHAEGRMITSVIASRGRFRRRLFGGGGCLFTPSELSSNLGYTIIGTEDDALDVAGYAAPIAAVNSSTSVTFAVNDCRLPQVGQRASLLDATRTLQATMTVLSNTPGSSSGATIVFTGPMPSGVSTSWVLSPTTVSKGVVIKSSFRAQLIGATGIRTSQQGIHICDGAKIGPTIGPAVQLSGGGASEYASMPRVHVGHLHLTSPCSGLGFERTAAMVVRATSYAGSALGASTAFGDVHVDNLVATGICNGPLAAFAGITRLFLNRATAQGINSNPSDYGMGTGFAMSLENIAYAYVGELVQYEQPGAAKIVCAGVATLVMGENVDGPAPTSGVTTLAAYGKWLPYTPTITPSSGAFPTGSSVTPNNVRYRMDRNKSWEMKGRIDIPPNLGTAAGPLTFSSPIALSSVDWETATITDEQHRSGQWDMWAGPGATTFSVYQVNNAGQLVAGAALLFRVDGEAG